MKHWTKRNQPSPAALAAKQERLQAERWARPCPPRPLERQPGEWLYRLSLTRPDGTVVGFVDLHAPARRRGARSRCDSFEVRDAWGAVVVERGGLHALVRAAPTAIWPHELSRSAISQLVSASSSHS